MNYICFEGSCVCRFSKVCTRGDIKLLFKFHISFNLYWASFNMIKFDIGCKLSLNL